MSVFLFLLVIFVLILVHEFGHFWMAKKTGMRVDEFGIGFPPKLASIKKGETEYSLNALPIGGFVKIFGEDALGADASPDRDRSFVAKPAWQQAVVLLAGVSMNMIFAWFLFIVVLALGVPTVVNDADATENARLVISEVLPEGPAAAVGVPRGAVITGLSAGAEHDQILNTASFQAFIEDRPNVELTVDYTYAGVTEQRTMAPVAGLVPDDPNRAVIGVVPTMIDTVALPLHKAIWEGTKRTFEVLVAVTVGISTLVYDTLLFQADLSGVAGPIGIVGLVDEASQFGFTSLLMFTALISINLAVVNLLPFPALDGGRLLFVLIEVIKGSPMKPVWVARLNTAGIVLLLLLMFAVTWNDIARLL